MRATAASGVSGVNGYGPGDEDYPVAMPGRKEPRFSYTATDLQNHENRWYDPTPGRWLSEDPIGSEAGDANLYRYVGNDPVDGFDANGLLFVGTGMEPVFKPQGFWAWLFGERRVLENYGKAYFVFARTWSHKRYHIGTAPVLESLGEGLPVYGEIKLAPELGGGKISQQVLERAEKLAAIYPQAKGETDTDYIKRLIDMAKKPDRYLTAKELKTIAEWLEKEENRHGTIEPWFCSNRFDNALLKYFWEQHCKRARILGVSPLEDIPKELKVEIPPGSWSGCRQMTNMWMIRNCEAPVTK